MPAKRIPRHETGVYYGWVLPMAWKWALKKLQWSRFKTCAHWLPFQNICTSYVLQLTSSVPQSPTLRRLRPPLAWRLSEPIWRHGVKLMAAKFKVTDSMTTPLIAIKIIKDQPISRAKAEIFRVGSGLPSSEMLPLKKQTLGVNGASSTGVLDLLLEPPNELHWRWSWLQGFFAWLYLKHLPSAEIPNHFKMFRE